MDSFLNKAKQMAQDKDLVNRARQEYDAIQREQGDTFMDKAKNRMSNWGDVQNEPIQAAQSAANQQAQTANPAGSTQMAQSQQVAQGAGIALSNPERIQKQSDN